jgi:glycosyltransferase involved in cell wall biosynthesis
MNILYISSSIIPSKSANSIHVVNMCQEFAMMGHDVTLVSSTHNSNSDEINSSLKKYYGADSLNLSLDAIKFLKGRGMELFISLYAIYVYLKISLTKNKPDLIISRNLYAAFLFSCILRKYIIYETHSPEKGLRMKLQRLLVFSINVHTVVISSALKAIIMKKYEISSKRISVLHDAAKTGTTKLNRKNRTNKQNELLSSVVGLSSFDKVIGYFGHLYSGRGIEIIEELARNHCKYIFLVYGGNEKEISYYRNRVQSENLIFMGHVSPLNAQSLMIHMDILLMPYQESVSIGIGDIDTSKWMSPMKMFEYMSCGVPIISSDLPVLREVLKHEYNSLLVTPNDINEWSIALERVANSLELEEILGHNAYKDYQEKYTWEIRARAFLKLHIYHQQ